MMTKKKKIVIIVVSIILVIAIAAGSAFAVWWFGGEPAKRRKKKVVVVKQYPSSSTQSSSEENSDSTSTDDETVSSREDETFEEDNSSEENQSSFESQSSDENQSSTENQSSNESQSSTESITSSEENNSDDYDDKRDLYEEPKEELVKYIPEYKVTSVKWKGPKGFVIVYADGDKNSKALANIIKDYFKKNADVDLKVVSDKEKEKKKEILVGNTNRYTSKLKENQYEVRILENKLVFEAGHFAMLEKAVDWFANEEYKSGYVNTLKGKTEDFVATKFDKYEYVWGDEFSGSVLDKRKWQFANRMAGSALLETRTDEAVARVREENLQLRAIRSYRKENPVAQYATTQSVNTMKTMSFMQGYLEMRARVPFVSGAWPSLWANSNGALNNNKFEPYTIEVDIFEVFSSVDTLVPNIHKWRGQDQPSQYNVDHYVDGEKVPATNYVFENTDNLTNEYHIYGFKWTETEMTMSVDGNEYMTFDLTEDFDQKDGMEGYKVPISILINNHMFAADVTLIGGASNVNNFDLPYEYDIDWIRLYQIPNEGILNLAE